MREETREDRKRAIRDDRCLKTKISFSNTHTHTYTHTQTLEQQENKAHVRVQEMRDEGRYRYQLNEVKGVEGKKRRWSFACEKQMSVS